MHIASLMLLGSGELGREFAIAAKRLGCRIIACDRYANAPAMQMADAFEVFPMLDGKKLRAAVEKHKPDVIVPEIEAIDTATLEELEKEGWRVAPSAKAVRLTMNRDGIREFAARELGLVTSKYRFAESREEAIAAAAEVGLPCVVKPARGEGSRNTLRIDDVAEGARVCADLLAGPEPALLVEELLVGRDTRPFGDYVSVESVVVNGRPHHLEVTGKLPLVPPFRETCAFWPAPVSDAERARLFALTDAALAALSVADGLTHTEIKLTEAGPRIIELNGRLGGFIADLAGRAAGLDLFAIAGRIALGLPVELPASPRLDRTTFVFNNLPPAGARRLLSVSGVPAVRALPGVTSYRPLFTPRRLIRGGFGTEELDLLRGSCAGPDEVLALCRATGAELSFDFEMVPDGAVRTFAATELPSWQALA